LTRILADIKETRRTTRETAGESHPDPAGSGGGTGLLIAFVANDAVRELTRGTVERWHESLRDIITDGQTRREIRRDRKAAAMAMACRRGGLRTDVMWAKETKVELQDWLEETFNDFWAAAGAKTC
jgi:hypothetical protein